VLACAGEFNTLHAAAQAVFVMPTVFPVTTQTLNYAGVAVGIVLVGALLFWFMPFIGGRNWYR
jgi:hypothetical protein